MHPNFEKADRLSREAIGAAIEVHRILGPGLLESIYEKCLQREFELRGIPVLNQEHVQITSYMKLLDVPLGLVLNFHEIKLVGGVSRMILPGANER